MEGGVAAAAVAGVAVDGPFEAGIDEGDVGGGAGAEGAAVEAEEFRGLVGVEGDEAGEVDGFLFVDEDVEEEAELGFEAEDAEGRLVELDFLFVGAMRGVVAGRGW